MRRAVPVLSGILERESRGWLAPFRERLITELKAQELSDEQIQAVSGRRGEARLVGAGQGRMLLSGRKKAIWEGFNGIGGGGMSVISG